MSFTQTQFIECLPLFVHMFWESHAIVQSYVGSVCAYDEIRQGELWELETHTHTHTHRYYLIHVGLFNLTVVHYITDSYQSENRASR